MHRMRHLTSLRVEQPAGPQWTQADLASWSHGKTPRCPLKSCARLPGFYLGWQPQQEMQSSRCSIVNMFSYICAAGPDEAAFGSEAY